jgi:hypothetical protein
MSTSNLPPSYGLPAGPGMIAFQANISASLGIRDISPRFSLARSAICRQLGLVGRHTSFFIRLLAVYISA